MDRSYIAGPGELSILKTVKQIGVTIPQSLLYRADKVIKESAGIKPAWSSG
jgi:hypothetical protein